VAVDAVFDSVSVGTTYKEELAGWYQTDSEKNEEPNLVTLVNLIGNFKTNIAPAGTVYLKEGDTTPTYYGEEVKSAYWKIANTAMWTTTPSAPIVPNSAKRVGMMRPSQRS